MVFVLISQIKINVTNAYAGSPVVVTAVVLAIAIGIVTRGTYYLARPDIWRRTLSRRAL